MIATVAFPRLVALMIKYTSLNVILDYVWTFEDCEVVLDATLRITRLPSSSGMYKGSESVSTSFGDGGYSG